MKRTEKTDRLQESSLLVIAYAFPPIPYGGTYRTLRLCRGLSESGTRLHVLTINEYADIPNDHDLLSEVPQSIPIHRTPIIDPWRRYQSWKKKYEKRKGFRYFNKAVTLILRFIIIPDHMVLWIPFAVWRGLRIIRDEKIESIYVSSPPNSSHIIGYLLKKITKVKWIADFRDPIVGNIAEVNLMSPSDAFSKFERRVRVGLEKLVVHNADKVITNTETHRLELTAKFGADKFHTIRNSFLPDDYRDEGAEKYAKFTICHLGSMYGLRKADILFAAISRLEKEVSTGSLDLDLFFIGLNDSRLNKVASDYGVAKYVTIKNLVPHRQAIQMMMKSHLLLLIKATGEGSYGQIPGKFYEYLGTRNRILCIGPKESEVSEIMKELNAGYVVEDDVNEMYSIIKREYARCLRGEAYSYLNREIDKYSSRNMVKHFISVMRDIGGF